MVRWGLIEQIVGHIEHHGRSSRFDKEVKPNLGTVHGNLPLVYEDFSLKKSFMDFTNTSGNKEITKGASSVY